MSGPAQTDGSGLFCPNCGNSATPDHEYCIHCGHDLSALREVAAGESEQPDATITETERREQQAAGQGDDIEAFRKRVRFLVSRGWEIEYDGHDEVVIVNRGLGSLWLHVLLFMFTAGIGNLFYAWYQYGVEPTRVTLQADGQGYRVRSPASTQTETTQSVTSVQQFTSSLIFVVIGLVIIITAGLSVVPSLFGLAFVLVGLYIASPVRQRIRDRHAPTAFGSTETVDERYVENTDRPCTVCGSRVLDGIVREYKQEFVVAGLPLYTSESGENYYCQDCQHLETAQDSEVDDQIETEFDIDETEIERELKALRTDDEANETPDGEKSAKQH
jgi:hypothetical protein